jgi:hypothetical protein
MRKFSYRARTIDGADMRGTITANSAPAAARALAAEGKIAIDIRERREFHLPTALHLRRGMSDEARIAFLQELAVLLRAGLPVHEALARLAEGVPQNPSYRKSLTALHTAVLQGMALSQAMEMQEEVFPKSLIGMVHAGEESGTLDAILGEAAAVLTEAHTLRESLRSALAYPLFLLAATIFSVLLMTVFVLPIFAALLRDLGVELPLPTQILLGVSDAVGRQPELIGVLLLTIALAATLMLRMPRLRLCVDTILLHIPVLGTFLCHASWQMILRTLAILLYSGIRLDRAVGLARSVTGNRALSHHLARMEQGLIEGRTFSQVIVREPYLPPLLRGMLAAGEAAGDLERLLQHAADYCQRRAGTYAVRMEALAEPVMIVIIASVIFFVVLSVLLPIFDMMDALM